MVFLSATRLRVKSIWYLPAFFLANEASAKALSRTAGFITGKELIDQHFTFWTLTHWRDSSAMKAFRSSAAHRKAMQKLLRWCDEAFYVHWTQEHDQLVDWQIVYSRMRTEGKVSKVREPSPGQLTNSYPPPKWTKLERTFKALSS